jgi:Cu+-exporting ATPase
MDCAHCALAIEKSLGRLEGVTKANVSFATEKAIVEYDAKQVSIEKIKQAIADAGYKIREKPIEKSDCRGARSLSLSAWPSPCRC